MKQFGLIGYPLKHSFSKEIHEGFGLYHYDIEPLSTAQFHQFMQEKQFQGINVTIPYKQAVIPYCQVLSDEAKAIGSVNTIINHQGVLYGYNTDAYGLSALLSRNKIEVAGKKVLILGTGGTSLTAQYVVQSQKAAAVTRVSRHKTELGIITYQQLSQVTDYQIIINTTPVGMATFDQQSLIDLTQFKQLEAVVDVIYNPLRTTLLQQAQHQKIKAVNGLYMLVAQAYQAANLFTQQTLSEAILKQSFKKIWQEKINIVLIGMPGVGKSTVAQHLNINKKVVDIDQEIVAETKMSINDLFAQYGENYFRDIETRITDKMSQNQNLIIACGGGIIKRAENIAALKKNGIIIFLDQHPDSLVLNDQRPLAKSKEDLMNLYQQRYQLYCQAADIRITETDLMKVCEIIKEHINENISD